MCSPFGHHFYHSHPMAECCCGHRGWHMLSREERLEWLRHYKENLERELTAVEIELEKVRKEKKRENE